MLICLLHVSTPNYSVLCPESQIRTPGSIMLFLNHGWSLSLIFFHPLVCLGKVLHKIQHDRVPKALEIAPCWPTATWYPTLLSLLFCSPIILPQTSDLLTLNATQLHPLRDKTFLAAWPVSGDNTVVLDFLRAQPTSSLAPGVLVRTSGTARCGKSSVAGVVQNRLIQFIIYSPSRRVPYSRI